MVLYYQELSAGSGGGKGCEFGEGYRDEDREL
jgi:hypothetical protein